MFLFDGPQKKPLVWTVRDLRKNLHPVCARISGTPALQVKYITDQTSRVRLTGVYRTQKQSSAAAAAASSWLVAWLGEEPLLYDRRFLLFLRDKLSRQLHQQATSTRRERVRQKARGLRSTKGAAHSHEQPKLTSIQKRDFQGW